MGCIKVSRYHLHFHPFLLFKVEPECDAFCFYLGNRCDLSPRAWFWSFHGKFKKTILGGEQVMCDQMLCLRPFPFFFSNILGLLSSGPQQPPVLWLLRAHHILPLSHPYLWKIEYAGSNECVFWCVFKWEESIKGYWWMEHRTNSLKVKVKLSFHNQMESHIFSEKVNLLKGKKKKKKPTCWNIWTSHKSHMLICSSQLLAVL